MNKSSESLEARLVAALHEVVKAMPDRPSRSWEEAKTRLGDEIDEPPRSASGFRSRTSRLALIVGTGVVAAGALGAGIAAADGAFNQQANKVLHQVVAGVPVTNPGTSPSPTGTANSLAPPPTPGQERLVLSTPGPEGSTLELWTYTLANGTVCHADVINAAGLPIAAGKPALPNDGACGGAGGGHIYRSASGALYWILANTVVPATSTVTMSFGDGTKVEPPVADDWMAVSLPYAEYASGFTQTEYDASGKVLQSFTNPPAVSGATASIGTAVTDLVVTTRDENLEASLVQHYRSMPGVTGAEAKIVPYTDVGYVPGTGRGGSPLVGPQPGVVLAIALSGRFSTPSGMSSGYELLVIDFTSGAVLDDTGGGPQNWPPGFAALPDLPVGSEPSPPTVLTLTNTDNGKTFTIVPSSRVEVTLTGSPTEQWQAPPTGVADAPVINEVSEVAQASGDNLSTWIAGMDGTRSITATATCPAASSGSCDSTDVTWSVRIIVSG
jgi:hypothetical protein